MNKEHCYLLALEVESMTPGKSYKQLPLHCTLVHRFLSGLTYESLSEALQPLFNNTSQFMLVSGEEEVFGPPPVRVNTVVASPVHYDLHAQLITRLNDLGVRYTQPQWIGLGYRPHITHHNGLHLSEGSGHLTKAVYLIEVKVPGSEGEKFVRSRYILKSHEHRTG